MARTREFGIICVGVGLLLFIVTGDADYVGERFVIRTLLAAGLLAILASLL